LSNSDWFGRAERALRTAELVLADGDTRGACSSAYYAMFYAARAALLAVGEGATAMAKTHSGLIAGFNRHLIRSGLMPAEFGQMLGQEASRRYIADYEGDPIEPSHARAAIDHAKAFVAAMSARFRDSPAA
jgi:uncharacterized protein (UPF0332 family)